MTDGFLAGKFRDVAMTLLSLQRPYCISGCTRTTRLQFSAAGMLERNLLMKPQTALAIWILVAGAAMAHAQTGIWMGVGPAPHAGAIKNAAFSADLVTVNDHAEGKPGINTTFHGKVARNSQGESYFAMELTRPEPDPTLPMRVTITDFAARTVTSLDQQSKTAYVSHLSATAMGAAPILTPGSSPATADGRPPATAAMAAKGPEVKTESLGTKDIAGLQAVGVRTVRSSAPNGGSDKPFVSTVDTWTSPDLKIIVLTEVRTSNGDHHVTRLENIVRTEPSAALFQVPSGYTVRDNAPMATNMH